MKKRNIILIAVIVIIVIIQFIFTGKPEVIENNPDDLLTTAKVPDHINNILRTSCYDCHSNETRYPWYSHVAPVSWLIISDIREGRDHLNFSDWNHLNKMQQAKFLGDIIDEVSHDEMPLKPYTMMHTNARLTKENRKEIVDWANAYGDSLFK